MHISETSEALAQARERSAQGSEIGRRFGILPLTPQPADDVAPLSYCQRRWLPKIKLPAQEARCPISLRLTGRVNLAALRIAFNRLQQTHEILRTRYKPTEDGGYDQSVSAEYTPLRDVTLRSKSEEDRVEEVWDRLRASYNATLDLSLSPISLDLFRISPSDYLLVGLVNHIAWDASSHPVFMRHFFNAYYDAVLGLEGVEPRVLQYADFARWEDRWQTEELIEENREFWLRRLNGFDDLRLPNGRKQGDPPSPLAGLPIEIGGTLFQEAVRLAKGHQMTVAMLFAGIIAAGVAKWSGKDRACVGQVINGRPPGTLDTIGCFAHTRPLALDLSCDPDLEGLLLLTRRSYLEAVDLRRPPPIELSGLLSVAINLRVGPAASGEAQPRTLGLIVKPGVTPLGFKTQTSRDVMLTLLQTPQVLRGWIAYAADRFSRGDIERLRDAIQGTLTSWAECPKLRFSQLPMWHSELVIP